MRFEEGDEIQVMQEIVADAKSGVTNGTVFEDEEAFWRVYEWKFMNCLEFCTSVVCAYSSEPDFRPLAYPFAQSHCCFYGYFNSWIFTDDEQPSRSKRTTDSGDDVHAVSGIDEQLLIKKCTHYEI